jgi:OCT family organic cation transporter-like MFS transporter 4/5
LLPLPPTQGISFALSSLGGSLRTSFMLSSIAELPSYLVAAWAIGAFGRHNTMAAMLLAGGGACAGCAFVPAGGARVGLAAVGKFGISGAFSVASIYTSELFPTLIRTSVLGAENQAARVGAIVAPFIIMAGDRFDNPGLVPFLTMGCAALLAGLLIFTLPETLGTPLPDTMEDMVGCLAGGRRSNRANALLDGSARRGLRSSVNSSSLQDLYM